MYQSLTTTKKPLYVSIITFIVLTLLLAGCGEAEKPLPSNLEVITSSAQVPEGATPDQIAPTEIVEPQATATALPPTVVDTVAPTVAATVAVSPSVAVANSTTIPVANTAVPPTVKPANTAVPPTKVVPTAVPPTKAVVPTKAAVTDIKKGVLLEPMSWESQTFNNCAPMSALMALSYYGVKLTQEQCGKALRPNLGDKHVRPEELIAFVQKQGFKIVKRENGTADKLRALLSAGVPVITQQWLHDGDDIGHYRTLRGYDLATNVFIFNDSMDNKPKTVVDVDFEEKLWKAYDRRYFPVYTAKNEATVMAILGADADKAANLNRAMAAARTYSQANPKDIDAWRNLGYLNYAMGDCKSAINVWEQNIQPNLKATDKGPSNRFLWYQLWPIECYNTVGNYQKVLKLIPNEIEQTKVFAEARYEHAVALAKTGKTTEAIAELKKAVADDPNYEPTYALLDELGAN